jgi:ankyrin repeat protein
MAKANPKSLHLADKKGFTPLHISCKFDDIETFNLLIRDANEYLPLHIASLESSYRVVSYIRERSTREATELNKEGKLPIELLLYEAEFDRYTFEYIQCVYKLLRANPESLSPQLV